MDNNQMPQTPISAIPTAPEMSAATASTGAPIIPPASSGLPPEIPAVTQASGGGSKKGLMIVVIVILLLTIAGAGGFYYYQTMMAGKSKPAETTDQIDTKGLDELNSQVQNVQITDPDQQLGEVDQQIDTLDATASGKSASPSAVNP